MSVNVAENIVCWSLVTFDHKQFTTFCLFDCTVVVLDAVSLCCIHDHHLQKTVLKRNGNF